MTWILLALVAIGLGGLAWGWFEAGWVRLVSIPVELERLPPELDGLRIVHLADLHLGFPSRGSAAVERAFAWTRERRPDLVLLSGDLLSRPSGEARLRRLLEDLPPTVAILGSGRLSRDVVAVEDRIEAHLRMPLSLTFDHRCVTGGEAARFLAAVLRDLEKDT